MSRNAIKRHLIDDTEKDRRVRTKLCSIDDDVQNEQIKSEENKRLSHHKEVTSPPTIVPGSPLPNLDIAAVIGEEICSVSLSSYKGRWLCIIFYPLDFDANPASAEIITECSRRCSEFSSLNCAVLCCSTDSCYAHLAWSRLATSAGGVGAVSHPMLSDGSHSFTRSFGLLDEQRGVARHSVVVVDPAQRVQQVVLSSSSGITTSTILQAVQRLQGTAASA